MIETIRGVIRVGINTVAGEQLGEHWSLRNLRGYGRAIAELGAAIRRTNVRMEEPEAPFSFPADCCPDCACGPEWSALAEKRERQIRWLIVLLRHKGHERDARFWETEV